MTDLRTTLKCHSCTEKAEKIAKFFKTGPGQYGEGDKFLGITVPQLRSLSKKFLDLPLSELQRSLVSEYHEERAISLLILISQFKKSAPNVRQQIFEFYCQHLQHVNNWDLVDLSAPEIVGCYMLDKKRDQLYQWAKDKNLWVRRIAIVATYSFIKQNQFTDTLNIAEHLLDDEEDLIHKATGWMLREVGKRKISILEGFLEGHYRSMPRTMLRYSIEKFPEEQRQKYLKNKINSSKRA